MRQDAQWFPTFHKDYILCLDPRKKLRGEEKSQSQSFSGSNHQSASETPKTQCLGRF